MRLKQIKLAGFKSFVDPTNIILQTHLTGVVGPNGCGKSNIIDAVRWVIGESSAKQLRGEQLTDVIFNGSAGRKPVGQAAIELMFDNSDGRLGGEYAQYNEIAIRRELNRDGQSHFYLNGVRCRRKDIMDVFLGTGLGPRSYAIIGQGMISELIEAKPEEIRTHLEEAAGTSVYKERRRETENRIQHTRENLARLNDLIEEIDKQLAHLKRQANAAERYKVLKQELRLLKAQLNALFIKHLDEQLAEQLLVTQRSETHLEAKLAEHRQLDTNIEKQRIQQTDLNDAFNEVQGRYYQIGSEIAKYEQQLHHLQERQKQIERDIAQSESSCQEAEEHLTADQAHLEELNSDILNLEPQAEDARELVEALMEGLQQAEHHLAEWQAQWDAFNSHAAKSTQQVEVEQTRAHHLTQRMQNIQQRIERLQEQANNFNVANLPSEINEYTQNVNHFKAQVEQLQQSLSLINQHISQQRQQNQQLGQQREQVRGDLHNLSNKKASLTALQEAALGKTDVEVKEWLEQNQLSSHSRLAENIKVEAGWELAAEAVLGHYLEAVCVDDLLQLREGLQNFSKGKVTFINTKTDIQEAPKANSLSTKIQSECSINHLVNNVYLAENITEAFAKLSQLNAHESIVTKEGIWLGANWLRISKASDAKAGVLQRKQSLSALDTLIDERQEQFNRLETELNEGQSQLHNLEEQRDNLQAELRNHSTQLAELQAQLSAKQASLEHIQQRELAVNQELAEQKSQLEELQQQYEATLEAQSNANEQKMKNDQKRDALLRSRDSHKDKVYEIRRQANEAKHKADEYQVRLTSSRNQIHYLTQNIVRTEKQLAQLHERKEQLQQQLAEVISPLPQLQNELAVNLSKRASVEIELTEARAKLQEVEHHLRELERSRNKLEAEANEIRDQLEQLRVNYRAMQVRRETYQEQISQGEYQLETLLAEMPPEADINSWQNQIEQIEARIARLGPINLAAIEEYSQLSERHTYLDSQRNDLVEALNALEEAIRKIDRESRTRLRETFDKANDMFKTLFPKIFGGGQAYLELSDEDILNTGIYIRAQPPGKRNSSIHLLSGGEKALTAIALVFALFHLNPAPFCMLDEVDAPLDDANVGRFCDIVKEMSQKVQFIFITHNKVTMEMAQQLAGITMNEPGVSRLVSVDIDEALAMAVS